MTAEFLFERHYTRIVRYAYKFVQDAETARDVAQDVFIAASGTLRKNPDAILTTAWLYKTARNACLSVLRRKRRIEFVPLLENDRFAGASGGSDAILSGSEVRAALQMLPHEQRSALMLTLQFGYSSKEAGEVLNVSAEAVRQRTCRALRRLRRILYTAGD